MPVGMTLFKERPRLFDFAWFCLFMLAGLMVILPVLQILFWVAPNLYANRLVHHAVVLAVLVPVLTYSARRKNRFKEKLVR